MKIDLTEREREYLADRAFWDWKYAEIDTWLVHIHPETKDKVEETNNFYKNLYTKLEEGSEEKDHKKLKWFEHKIIHLIATFILGVALATVFHVVITNHQVRTTAEAVCNVFGRDAEECKGGIDDVLNMSDEDIQNNMTIKGE